MSRSPPTARVASITEAWIETLVIYHVHQSDRVASITEAWIETIASTGMAPLENVASITEAWIETRSTQNRRTDPDRRLHHGGVDRNSPPGLRPPLTPSRLHHGGVDRNSSTCSARIRAIVASITEAWIETSAARTCSES